VIDGLGALEQVVAVTNMAIQAILNKTEKDRNGKEDKFSPSGWHNH
jgi:hypothetical protein